VLPDSAALHLTIIVVTASPFMLTCGRSVPLVTQNTKTLSRTVMAAAVGVDVLAFATGQCHDAAPLRAQGWHAPFSPIGRTETIVAD
jgi:hypothetical protein